MNGEALSEFAKLLGNFQPGWVLAILVTTILAYRAPQILKEFFVGVRGLLITRRHDTKRKQT
jgi:hypothetical protein